MNDEQSSKEQKPTFKDWLYAILIIISLVAIGFVCGCIYIDNKCEIANKEPLNIESISALQTKISRSGWQITEYRTNERENMVIASNKQGSVGENVMLPSWCDGRGFVGKPYSIVFDYENYKCWIYEPSQ